METSRPATWVRTPKVPFRQIAEMRSKAKGLGNKKGPAHPRS